MGRGMDAKQEDAGKIRGSRCGAEREWCEFCGQRRRKTKCYEVRHMKVLGHIMRRKEAENMVLPGKVEGKRARGR